MSFCFFCLIHAKRLKVILSSHRTSKPRGFSPFLYVKVSLRERKSNNLAYLKLFSNKLCILISVIHRFLGNSLEVHAEEVEPLESTTVTIPKKRTAFEKVSLS